MLLEGKNSLKLNKIGQLPLSIYIFGRVENINYLRVTINEDNKHQIDLQERIKRANKSYLMLQKILEIEVYIEN